MTSYRQFRCMERKVEGGCGEKEKEGGGEAGWKGRFRTVIRVESFSDNNAFFFGWDRVEIIFKRCKKLTL